VRGYCTSTKPAFKIIARAGKAESIAQTFAQLSTRKAGKAPATGCATRSVLYVKTVADRGYKIVFTQAPTEERPGSSIEPIDWSSSGQYLLAKLTTYQFEGEGADRTPLIYDAYSGLIYSPDLLIVLRKHYGRACAANVVPEGFTPDGRVVISVTPVVADETYESLQTLPNCVKRKQSLGLDFQKQSAESLGSSYKVESYSFRQRLK